jgi:acetyl-CoA carboxylase beta subunit
MSWFTRIDKLKTAEGERKVRTEGLWQKCDQCREIIWKKDLEASHHVCPRCGAHFRIDAMTRLRLLFDGEHFEQLPARPFPTTARMLTRRAGEADSVLVLADGDVVGGAGLAEAGADTVELGTDG